KLCVSVTDPNADKPSQPEGTLLPIPPVETQRHGRSRTRYGRTRSDQSGRGELRQILSRFPGRTPSVLPGIKVDCVHCAPQCLFPQAKRSPKTTSGFGSGAERGCLGGMHFTKQLSA